MWKGIIVVDDPYYALQKRWHSTFFERATVKTQKTSNNTIHTVEASSDLLPITTHPILHLFQLNNIQQTSLITHKLIACTFSACSALPERRKSTKITMTTALSKYLPFGKKHQMAVIAFIDDNVSTHTLNLRECINIVKDSHRVSHRTAYRWWKHYQQWGELPFETKQKKKKMKYLSRRYKRTSIITEQVVQAVKQIVDSHPEYYLDEIVSKLAEEQHVHLSMSSVERILHTKLDYSLQVCYESALQRDQLERQRFRDALDALVHNANQLIVIDEVHKDKSASRRRKAWGMRNHSGGMAISRWFRDEVRYTMIAALDIDGFIDSTLQIIHRNQLSDEGAAGTVTAEMFEDWVQYYLCPTLGNYSRGEARSIVMMDNASTHMGQRVQDLIRATGAYLIYSAPYSPDLSPIELAFNIYKKSLKRHHELFRIDWYSAHQRAISSVTRDICIKEYRKCGIPHSYEVLTEEEQEEDDLNKSGLFGLLVLLI